MRPIVKGILAVALGGAISALVGCSADSPTAPKTTGGGGSGASPLVLQMTVSNPTPVAGGCTMVGAYATYNGVPVPDGTSVLFSAVGGGFAENGQSSVSIVTLGGAATASVCGSTEGTSKVTGNVSYNGRNARSTVIINFTTNGLPTGPFITQCANPSSGPVSGGTAVTITGGGFCQGSLGAGGGCNVTPRVYFRVNGNAYQAGVTAATDSQINATTPAIPGLNAAVATPAEVDVVLGALGLSVPNCFTYTGSNLTPEVDAILPSEGSKLGGTRATVVGSNFEAPVQVFFQMVSGAPLEAQVLSVTFNQIVIVTPNPFLGETLTGPVPASVSVKNVLSGMTSANSVTYNYVEPMQIFGITPDHGDSSTEVTIQGQGFACPVIVTFGGNQGTVASCTATQVLAYPPATCATGAAAIGVTSLATGETTTGGSFTIIGPTVTTTSITQAGGGGFSPPPPGTSYNVTVVGTGLSSNGQPSGIHLIVSGGTASVTSVTTSPSGVQTVVISATPAICSPTETITIQNAATGCTASPISVPNPSIVAPTASFTQTPGTTGSGQVSFNGSASTGTGTLAYAWQFAATAGTGTATPSTAISSTVSNVAFACTTGPCTWSATLTVTDSCGKTATATQPVTPP